MIFSKELNIDNLDGAKSLRISTIPQTDLFRTSIAIRLTNLSPKSIKELFIEFNSSRQIMEANQKNKNSFSVPIEHGQFHVDIWIHSESEGVSDFIVEKQY